MTKTVKALITVADGGSIDNTLPGNSGSIDNTLPDGRPGHPWLGGRPDRPDNELPGGRPDHPWLGGRPDHPGNALPGYGRPDNSLPIAPVRPGHDLPPIVIDPGFGGGIKPPVDPGYGGGRPRPDRPDNSLPGAPARPDQGLPGAGGPVDPGFGNRPPVDPGFGVPPGLGNGNFPIYIPPGSVAPGLPSLPIVLPTYLPEGSALVIPILGPQPKDVPAGQTLAVIWYGPGTIPTVAYVAKGATPTPK